MYLVITVLIASNNLLQRLTDLQSFNPYSYMINTWSSSNNILNVDFELYSTMEDLENGVIKWPYCNYDDGGVAFPEGLWS